MGTGVGIKAGAPGVFYAGAMSGKEGERRAEMGVVVGGGERGYERTDYDGSGAEGLEKEEQEAEAETLFMHGRRYVGGCGQYQLA